MRDDAYIYFMANNHNNVLYLGVTSNLERRVWEHKNHVNSECFTSKYNCIKLVYYEYVNSIKTAIDREKQLKNWKREWKNELIETSNPNWDDLSEIAGQARNDEIQARNDVTQARNVMDKRNSANL